jgi:predicted Rossmann-fold nucleotide-binding protein
VPRATASCGIAVRCIHAQPEELYDQFDTNDSSSYHRCRDWRIYDSFIDPATKLARPVDVDVQLMRRVHDASIAEALEDLLDLKTRLRSVAIMGGHDVPRDAPVFGAVAVLAQQLAQAGLFVLTGGGPGLMEAANLGAYTAGSSDPLGVLEQALTSLKAVPTSSDPIAWLRAAYLARRAMGAPATPSLSRNVGIPTWFYGHEPPNVFATDIAKYFENSVREEGLLAVALAGVIFAEGNAGTVQEIFQDACQNYYRTYDGKKSPMVLFGTDYWAGPPATVRHNPRDKRKSVYPLLEKLATEKGFSEYLLVTDDIGAIIPFLKAHPPALQ